MKLMTPLWCATILAACASIVPPTAAESEQLAKAHELLVEAPDQAANAAEQLLKSNPKLREARLLLAESSLAMARSNKFQGTQLHLMDSVRNFEQVLADAENQSYARELRLLSDVHYQLRQWAHGSAAARRSADGFAKRPGINNQKEYASSRLSGARCDFRMFIEERQPEIENGTPAMNGIVNPEARTLELATIAAAGYDAASRDFPTEATNQLAAIQRWLGQNGEAIKVYERGLIAYPQEAGIHDAYISWMRQLGQEDALVGAYRSFVREKPAATILRWFEGRAIYMRADRLRKEGNFQGAIAIYDKSRNAFSEYLAVMPQHRDTTNQWLALCDLSMARCAADGGDMESAETYLFRAGETSPLATEYLDGLPQLTDSYGNHFTGAAFAIHTALTQSPDKALERTLAFNEAVVKRFPDQWGFVYNNAALAARDLGVQLASAGDDTTAMALWERSYKHYGKAVELSPTDARIVNDCGLMLIYHLNRDFGRARKLFERAIKIGTEQLMELPADTSERDRQLLEEAVGDAWQNIAVLLREHQDAPFADYQIFCEQAVKYYPYQRREAAALLRNKGGNTLGSTGRPNVSARTASTNASSAGGSTQGSAAEALKKAMPQIEEHTKNADYDSVLNILDKLSKDCKGYAPYYLLLGKSTWHLANQARDSGRRGTELFYQDAVRALKRAVELEPEPNAPRQLLAQAQYDAGETEAANTTLSELLLHLQSQGGGSDGATQSAHQLRANSAARAYAKAKQDGTNNADLLTAARISMRWLEQQNLLDADLLKLWSATEQWAETPAEAVSVYIRASERAPTDFAHLEQLVAIAANNKQLPLAIEALAKRDDAGTVWYRGKAQFYLAGDQRMASKVEDAVATLDKAKASFAQSMTKNAGYKNSCEQWIAMCIGKQGCIALSTKDYDNAEKLLLEAATLRPDLILEDLGLTETTKRGILTLVDVYYRKNDLKKLESISRRAADAANSDIDLLNNSGLFARDYGNQIERVGQTEQAQEMYEQSYKAYTRAQQLDPTNVRLRNDCALIAIYHLERDWDLCRKLLDEAIKDGELSLLESPPEDATEKEQLEEAVGDCYENLALWHIKHSKDGKAAKAAATKSQDYHPGKGRPGARRHLRSAERLLQGK